MSVDAASLDITPAQVRRWLTYLRQPDKLDEPAVRHLLQFHGRLPYQHSSVDAGKAAVDLFIEKIQRLKPVAGSESDDSLPYRVLTVCFVQGAKLFQAANQLGLSERQLSRERARAIDLLKAELEVSEAGSIPPARIPVAERSVSRTRELGKLATALERHRSITVYGAPGVGKSALVAALVSSGRANRSVFWHQFRPSINDSLPALLFELGEHVASEGTTELARYVHETLPMVDSAVGSRVALKVLARKPRLLVFDDCDVPGSDAPVFEFVQEVAERLSLVRTVIIRRRPTQSIPKGDTVEVPPFDRCETALFLKSHGVTLGDSEVDQLHHRTGGNAALLLQALSFFA